MGTSSSIAVKHGDVIKAVYCHWDGYLDHNGQILLQFYNSAKANNLVALGDLSTLGKDIGEKHDFDVQQDYIESELMVAVVPHCTFYGRDRGEEGTSWRTFHSESAWTGEMGNMGCEYFYLMDNGVWYVSTGNELTPLHEAIEQEHMEEME